METTWRGTAGLWLVGAALGVSLWLGLRTGWTGAPAGLTPALWALVGLNGSALLLAGAQRRRADRYRRHLALGLTHHLRTSLAHIQAYNEMLLLGNESSEAERQSWLEIVGREMERLRAAVENVLLLVGGSGERIPATRKPFDLGALVEDVAAAYEGPAGSRLSLESWPSSELMVQGDPSSLRHALINLFEGLGGCAPADALLSASLTADRGTATLKVGIDGNGAAPRLTARPTTDPDACAGVGFGLELAVVEHAVKAGGGRAVPFREIGRSGYRIELPVAPA